MLGVPDPEAMAKGFVRVVDESDEDYLYASDYFVELQLTPELEQALLTTV